MKNNREEKGHIPVMLQECLEYFSDMELKVFFDGTLGGGGHAEGILSNHPEIETYFGCDRDPRAIHLAQERLKPWEEKVKIINGNFRDLDQYLEREKIKTVDGFFLI